MSFIFILTQLHVLAWEGPGYVEGRSQNMFFSLLNMLQPICMSYAYPYHVFTNTQLYFFLFILICVVFMKRIVLNISNFVVVQIVLQLGGLFCMKYSCFLYITYVPCHSYKQRKPYFQKNLFLYFSKKNELLMNTIVLHWAIFNILVEVQIKCFINIMCSYLCN